MSNEKWKPLEKLVVVKKKRDTLNKLHELITDPLTKDSSVFWISRLLDSFLRDVADVGGFKVDNLLIVTEILQFLAQRASDVNEYGMRLGKMLELCELPPLLGQTGNCLGYPIILERYFTKLGFLMIELLNERDTIIVLRAIESLLVRGEEGANMSVVKADFCFLAMERSEFPKIVSRLLEIHTGIMFKRVLDLALLLAANSSASCHQMLETGILNHLTIEMDLKNAYGEDKDDNDESYLRDSQLILWKQCTAVATNIARLLVQSILSPDDSYSDLRKLAKPNSKVTRKLRDILRRQVCETNRGNTEDIMLRNDLADLILAGVVAWFPAWNLVNVGLAEDLILLSVATETGARDTWAENVKFRLNNEDDLAFKKMMLSIVRRLCDYPGAAITEIMSEHRVIAAILELVETRRMAAIPGWLSEFAMRILARLIPKMSREFIFHKGAMRLVQLIAPWGNLGVKFDNHAVMHLTKTICNIVIRTSCPLMFESFHQAGLVFSLVELANRILAFDRLTTEHQRILTLLIATIGEIGAAKETKEANEAKDERIIMLTKWLKRCFYQRKDDFQLDQRLLIAIGSCIWECIVSRPENTEKFVKNGGTYMLLDVIENSIFPVRCVYLGILTDMMCSAECGVLAELCTWRGATNRIEDGFTSLLAKSWREEEIRTGVKRTPEGFIEDTELPIMGTEHRISVLHTIAATPNHHHHSSPAIVSLLGSVRPKIYALRRRIKDQADRYEIAKQHYKILSENDTDESAMITMYIADRLYRFSQGEVWSEVSRYLEDRGVHLLGMDGEIMILMNQRHSEWSTYVRGLQETLHRARRKSETERESREIARIRESKLGSALSALEKIDYIRRTTERDYQIRVKNEQRAQIKDAFPFSGYSERKHCHSCFDDKTNVTTIFQETYTIPSMRTNNSTNVADIPEVLPVSPAESLSLETLESSSTEDSLNLIC